MVQRHPVLPTRREFLGRACRCSAGLAALTLLPACATEIELPGPRLEWSELPDGARVIVMDGSVPIEISRDGDRVHARSLLCTHQGCQVIWQPESSRYLCPCHEGVFDHSGEPVMGPPRAPLRQFAVVRSEGYLQVDARVPLEVE